MPTLLVYLIAEVHKDCGKLVTTHNLLSAIRREVIAQPLALVLPWLRPARRSFVSWHQLLSVT